MANEKKKVAEASPNKPAAVKKKKSAPEAAVSTAATGELAAPSRENRSMAKKKQAAPNVSKLSKCGKNAPDFPPAVARQKERDQSNAEAEAEKRKRATARPIKKAKPS